MMQKLLFSLDTLLDTRLATLSQLRPAYAEQVVSDPKVGEQYRNRVNDLFLDAGLSETEFKEHYAKRNAETLVISRPTAFLFELSSIGYQLLKKSLEEPMNVKGIEFHINFYPYRDLTTEEREMIIHGVKSRLQDDIVVRGVYHTPQELMPATINTDGYTGVFFYDFRDWLKCHYSDNVSADDIYSMPSISVYTTIQLENQKAFEEFVEYKNPLGEVCDPLYGFRAMFAPYFYLDGLSFEGMSIIKPEDYTEIETTTRMYFTSHSTGE